MTRSFIVACALAAAVVSVLSAQPPGIAWEPYALQTYDGQSHQIDLGRLKVLESRTAPPGPVRVITVAFLRLKSSSRMPGSPIVFLMGGPGIPASVMAPIPPYWSLFDALRAHADVILLDQRGLGLSSPTLDCPPVSQRPPLDLFRSTAAFVAAYKQVVSACAAHFRDAGVEPLAYTDAAVVDDVDDLRAALGASRVSLLGFSYGTRLAMTYVRRHPTRVDRVVLQGVTDDQAIYRSGAQLEDLYTRLAPLAAVDPASAAFGGDLVSRTRALLARTAREPIDIAIRTTSGERVTIPVSREGLAGIVAGRLADPRIPALIATLENHDVSVLRFWIESAYNDMTGGAGSLMARAVTCSQRPAAARMTPVDAESASSLFGPAFDNFSVSEDFCRALGEGGVVQVPHLQAPLARPALFIGGTLDDRTPLANVRAMQGEFVSPTVLSVENGGHEVLPEPAVRAVVADFLAGSAVADRPLRVDRPRFLSIEDARLPPRRPGQ